MLPRREFRIDSGLDRVDLGLCKALRPRKALTRGFVLHVTAANGGLNAVAPAHLPAANLMQLRKRREKRLSLDPPLHRLARNIGRIPRQTVGVDLQLRRRHFLTLSPAFAANLEHRREINPCAKIGRRRIGPAKRNRRILIESRKRMDLNRLKGLV